MTPGKVLAITIILTACSLCACAVPSAAQWEYAAPPVPATLTKLPAGGVWCESLDSAKYMAQTGWFSTDCSSDPETVAGLPVIGVEHFYLQDVKVWVVRARGRYGKMVWIPLPDHEWA